MKDKLEQFVEENRDSFDSFSPDQAEKVWGRIEAERKGSQRGKIILRYFLRAASVLLIFGLSYLFHDYMDRNKDARIAEEKMNDIYQQLPELKEAESYYSSLVSNKLEEMKPFLAENPGISKAVDVDLSELDSVYVSLKNDLKDNVANDQIIEAMIQNYRLKLRILEELQSEIKQEKNKENAKPKINI
jgi:hypothetical protein